MAADQTSPRCPRSRTNRFRVSQSHTTSVRSRLDVAMVRPSRAKVMVVIPPVCSFRVSTTRPSATSQTISLPIWSPISRCLLSGVKTADASSKASDEKFVRTVSEGKSQTWNWPAS